jgi:hypothetical protein
MWPFGPRPVWKTLLAIVPGPFVAWVNSYLELFDRTTLIANPAWTDANDNALAASVPLVIISVFASDGRHRPWFARPLRYSIWGAAGLTLISFVLRILLSIPGIDPVPGDVLSHIWKTLYVALIVVITLAITFAVLRHQAPA